MTNTTIRKGIYQHFKGKLYRVIGEGLHTEDMTYFVIYKPLYESNEKFFIRPKDMFTGFLPNTNIPRFKFVREEYE